MSNRSMMTRIIACVRVVLMLVLVTVARSGHGFQIVSQQSTNLLQDLNADHCEFYIDGVAEVYTYESGLHRYKMYVELISLAETQSLGVWVRYRDRESGIVGETVVLATPAAAANKWQLEFEIEGKNQESYFSRDIIEVAFFADKVAPTPVPPVPSVATVSSVATVPPVATVATDAASSLRYWVSNRGRNYSWKEIMSEPTYVTRDGKVERRWADFRSAVFDQKRVCAH